MFGTLCSTIIRLIAGFLRSFCIFLNEESTYHNNFGRFGKCEKRATFLVFSIFRPFPNLVYSESNNIQETPTANSTPIKSYVFTQFDRFGGPREFFEHFHQVVPNILCSKSNFKQQKSAAECVSINFYGL